MSDVTHWSFPSQMQPEAAEVDFDLDRALRAVVRLSSHIPEDGFTAGMLGTERTGNGVVIRDNGLIVTIGYLITEAEAIWITTHDGRVVAGHPLAYDFATGMGLVLPLGTLGLEPVPFGTASTAVVDRPLALDAGVSPFWATGSGVAQIHGVVCDPSSTGPPRGWLVIVRLASSSLS